MKLTKKDKIKIIKLLNEGYGVSYLSKKFKISTSTVGTIRSLYRIHGYDFLNKTKKNNYSLDFKISIIKLIKSGSAVYDIATKYNINTGVIFS